MELPETLKQHCQEYFEAVKKNERHLFNPAQRVEFYKWIEGENYPEGTLFLEFLQFLAAQHVLPIWEENVSEEYYQLPNQLLALTEDILTGKVTRDSKILDLLVDEASNLFGNLEYEDHGANALNAGEAAYEVLSGIKYRKLHREKSYSIKITDEDIREQELDPTGLAVLAYAAICKDSYPTGELDPSKTLEFWEWWFFEAIPQAWDLAHQNNP